MILFDAPTACASILLRERCLQQTSHNSITKDKPANRGADVIVAKHKRYKDEALESSARGAG